MISFDEGKNKFNFRVAGLFIDKQNDRFLTCTSEKIDFCVLPGGRVEMGEDTKQSLFREIQEELGCEAVLTGLKVVTENFFEFDGQNYHELQYVYFGEILDANILAKQGRFKGIENKDIYEWVSFENFDKINYMPKHLVPIIKEVFSGNLEFRHIIHRGNG